ncbi:hypothetical protein EVAR_81751_1 [Eumeta japonica]|uniref:Uncharacterized protein n=1 Tax=Eumeta variegata TaxID=151549 RepID=A0A4C1UI93_EUMVA|nr:hypothetical protein EVAR_81751_1 [Eumeta japonica]
MVKGHNCDSSGSLTSADHGWGREGSLLNEFEYRANFFISTRRVGWISNPPRGPRAGRVLLTILVTDAMTVPGIDAVLFEAQSEWFI